MSIDFHCDHCGKLIRAPHDAAGRRGKCPSCNQSVYIRTPPEELESLDLAPIDEAAEAVEREANHEAHVMAAKLLRERDAGPDVPPGARLGTPAAPLSPELLEDRVIGFLGAMATTELDKAAHIVDQIRPQRAAVIEIIERLVQDSVPPAGCENVPPPVLRGFLNMLREKL